MNEYRPDCIAIKLYNLKRVDSEKKKELKGFKSVVKRNPIFLGATDDDFKNNLLYFDLEKPSFNQYIYHNVKDSAKIYFIKQGLFKVEKTKLK
jgi:hypothetical protein